MSNSSSVRSAHPLLGRPLRTLLLGTAAVVLFLGVDIAAHTMTTAQAQSAAAMPAVPVGVQTIGAQSVQLWSSFSGRMQAVDQAVIRPEVNGRITEVRITDGQTVKAGDVMFVIDPRPYDAAVAKAEANLASARTTVILAKTELDRAASLVKTQAIAQQLYDEKANAFRVAQANVLAAQADLTQAQVDDEHTSVRAPIDGRVSRAEITLGNLVQAGPNAPVLTSIVSNKGIYADFDVDEQTYLQSVHAHATTTAEQQKIPVEVIVQGDEGHPYRGTIESFDNQINTTSGTIRARARFDNADGSLVPGMFVVVKMASGTSQNNALLVSERAIGNDQSKRFVFVVGADNKVVYREVNLGDQVDGSRIVLSGLQSGDKVIVDGVQHVRPDVVVSPKEIVAEAHSAETTAVAAN